MSRIRSALLAGVALAGLASVCSGPALANHRQAPWNGAAVSDQPWGKTTTGSMPLSRLLRTPGPPLSATKDRLTARVPWDKLVRSLGPECAQGACLPLWARTGQAPTEPQGGPFAGNDPPPAILPLPGALPLLLVGLGALAPIRRGARRRNQG